jgi:hypothetical protein
MIVINDSYFCICHFSIPSICLWQMMLCLLVSMERDVKIKRYRVLLHDIAISECNTAISECKYGTVLHGCVRSRFELLFLNHFRCCLSFNKQQGKARKNKTMTRENTQPYYTTSSVISPMYLQRLQRCAIFIYVFWCQFFFAFCHFVG